MTNARNSGHLIGRLARDPHVSDNRDGSHTVLFTLMVERNYTNGDGVREADAIPLEAFVPASASSMGPFGLIHQGDLVGVATRLRQDHYVRNDGTEAFPLKVIVEDVTFLESRSVTEGRLATRVAEAEQRNAELRQQRGSAVSPEIAFAPEAPSAPTFDDSLDEIPF